MYFLYFKKEGGVVEVEEETTFTKSKVDEKVKNNFNN